MPEVRGVQATEEVKEEWIRAYQIYLEAPGDRYDAKKDRTERINHVADTMRLKRKQAKRRVRNYEAWWRNMKKGKVVMAENFAELPEPKPVPPKPQGSQGSRQPRYPGTSNQGWNPRHGSR